MVKGMSVLFVFVKFVAVVMDEFKFRPNKTDRCRRCLVNQICREKKKGGGAIIL